MINLKKLYFGVVSLVSLITLSISLWITLSVLWKLFLISDKEYLARYSYNSWLCSEQVKNQLCWSNLQNCKYDKKEYEKLLNECKEQEKKRVLLTRYYNLKTSLIWSTSTFVVFLIIFLFHYWRFKKQD